MNQFCWSAHWVPLMTWLSEKFEKKEKILTPTFWAGVKLYARVLARYGLSLSTMPWTISLDSRKLLMNSLSGISNGLHRSRNRFRSMRCMCTCSPSKNSSSTCSKWARNTGKMWAIFAFCYQRIQRPLRRTAENLKNDYHKGNEQTSDSNCKLMMEGDRNNSKSLIFIEIKITFKWEPLSVKLFTTKFVNNSTNWTNKQ